MGRVALVSAMDAELREVLRCLPDARQERHAGRTFHVGHWHGHEVVAVLTGIGKVAAALTTTMLAERYQVGSVVFTGAAGGLHPEVKVGDWIVVGDEQGYVKKILGTADDYRRLYGGSTVPPLQLSRLGEASATAAPVAR